MISYVRQRSILHHYEFQECTLLTFFKNHKLIKILKHLSWISRYWSRTQFFDFMHIHCLLDVDGFREKLGIWLIDRDFYYCWIVSEYLIDFSESFVHLRKDNCKNVYVLSFSTQKESVRIEISKKDLHFTTEVKDRTKKIYIFYNEEFVVQKKMILSNSLCFCLF